MIDFKKKMLTAIVITPEPAWPVVDGWSGRHYQLIRSMAQFCELDVVTLAPPLVHVDSGDAQRQLGARSFTVIRHSRPSKQLMALKSLLTSEPMGSLLFRSEGLRSAIAGLSARNRYDVCLVLGDVCMAGYAAHVQARMHLLDMCDDLALSYDRRAVMAGNGVVRTYYRRQAKCIRSYMRRTSLAFTRILAISEVDAESLSRDFEIPVVRVPNAVDVGLFRPLESDGSVPHDPRLLFVGAMRSWSNQDAVEWFASSVMPQILQENPATRLQVVGSGTEHLAVSNSCVVLRGFAEDLVAEYRACDVFVCPLRVGTGIKNKLMEALASGCAIVSTTVGIEGLAVHHGKHLLVADQPLEFAHAVNRLLREPELRKRLGRAARAFTERSLSPETLRNCLRAAMLPDRNLNLNAYSTDL